MIPKAIKKQNTLFVKSAIRGYIKESGCNTATDVTETDALNEIIIEVLDSAIKRAKANNRKTVLVRDL